MKRMLALFAAAMVAALALGLWYMPGDVDARIYNRLNTGAAGDVTPSPSVPPAATPEPTQAMTPAPLLTPEPTPTPLESGEDGEGDAIDIMAEPGDDAAADSGEEDGESIDIPDGDDGEDTDTENIEETAHASEAAATPTPAIASAATPTQAVASAATPAPSEAPAVTSTASATQSGINSVIVPTPIPRTPRTSPPSAPLAYEPSIDESELSGGVITVRVYNDNASKLKFRLKKDATYNYDMRADNSPYRFPMNMGEGSYDYTVYQNVSGDSYKILASGALGVALSSPLAPYLQSIQLVDWDPSMAPILEALKFAQTEGSGATEAIYTRLANYLTYDFSKLGKLKSGYLPDINDTYESGMGICFDMSSLFASMLRSAGVPARLMMGNTKLVQGYHAWNEVYVNGEWVIVDLTVDTQLREYGDPYEFAKKKSDYSSTKRY